MIASGNMKRSLIGQAGGENEWNDNQMMYEKQEFDDQQHFVDQAAVAEERMMSMVERMEKWNNQKKASKLPLLQVLLQPNYINYTNFDLYL